MSELNPRERGVGLSLGEMVQIAEVVVVASFSVVLAGCTRVIRKRGDTSSSSSGEERWTELAAPDLAQDTLEGALGVNRMEQAARTIEHRPLHLS